ncbi:PBP1A family penicillin-binding protein [Candidatus Dependentiae bacterium]|nr:PBP1A family penicillin-binding protein [Candidatus Dependentiae bacterium]
MRYLISVFFIIFSVACGTVLYLFNATQIDFSVVEQQSIVTPSVLLDDQGHELMRFEQDKREPVAYEKIPPHLVEAFVAAEDHKFFEHIGVSFKGIIRSMLVNLYYRRAVQGASTITQQLARLLFLSSERTLTRKLKELFFTLQLEQQLTKEQILELYLNNIYFGRGIYGVEAASRRFWNKTVTEITLEEAATLAAVAKSARFYSPLNAPRSSKQRRNVILRSMCNLKIITQEECAIAQGKELILHDHLPGSPMRLYLYEWVRQWAEQTFGKNTLYRGGLKIKTTIDSAAQEKAEKSFSAVVGPMREKMGDNLNGGMVCLEVGTGFIKAAVGGFDFKQSQFNRAFQAYRQMGSSFKPILYSYALNQGIGMDRVFVDEPIEIELPGEQSWKPRNWNRKFEGPMTLIRALARSNNIVSIKLLMEVGIVRVCDWARRFGIHRRLLEYPSLALGIAEATVQENAAAFNVFANNGIYIQPTMVEWVKNSHGTKVWQVEQVTHRAIPVRLCSQMVNALSQRMELTRRQSPRQWIDAETIGKSGSTNGAASVWFVGSTPSLTTAVYLGYDDNKPLGSQVFASKTAFPIWKSFNKSLTHASKHFYKDPSLHEICIDWVTGKRVRHYDRDDSDIVPILE